jgi:hypothetical protein
MTHLNYATQRNSFKPRTHVRSATHYQYEPSVFVEPKIRF